MEINSTGIVKSDLNDYLNFWVTKLREVFGNNFVIKKEGVVDNIATAGSLTCLALEDVMMFLAKNMNPYTAEGEWQDALYALVGLQRNYATFTKVIRTIEGNPNQVCDVKSIRFKNAATDDIFELNTAITLDGTGKGTGSFTAAELGAIDLPSDATLELINNPDGVDGVYYSEGNVTIIGDNYEDDSEFRLRWIMTNSIKQDSKTEGGMRVALLPLCGNDMKNLIIRQNRATQTYLAFPKHTMNIIIKSAESDTTIANTIFNNLTDGVGLYGSTSVTVKDDEGQNVLISFTRGTGVSIYFNIEVVLKPDYLASQVFPVIKSEIVNNAKYSMGEKVIANDFYEYINKVDGVDYVTTLEISTDDTTWEDILTMDVDEFATVTDSNITIEEYEE